MKYKNIILGVLLSLSSSIVFAHGPTPQKVSYMVEVSKPSAEVWATLKDFKSYSKWNYYAPTTSYEVNGEEQIRKVTYRDSSKSVDKFRSADDEIKSVKWEVNETTLPVNDMVVTVKVYDNGEGKSKVEMKSKFYRKYMQNPPIPEGQDDATAVKAVEEYTKNALNSIKANLEKQK